MSKSFKKEEDYLEKLFPDGYYWMQNRDSKHKAEITPDFINEKLDMIMTSPKGSSDLNPIEKHLVLVEKNRHVRPTKIP